MLNSLRAFVDIAILCGVIVGSTLSALGLLGAFVPAIDVINHFQFAFLIITLICLATTFVWPFYFPSFKPLGRKILMVPLACSLIMVGPELYKNLAASDIDKGAAKQKGDKILTVMTFNIYLGNWNRIGTARSILKHDPDIVLLQEYAPNRFKQQAELKKRYPYQTRCRSWRRCTLAILSKYPLDQLQSRTLGPKDKRDPVHGKLLSATLRLPGYKPLRLHSLHADWPNPLGDQQAQFADLAAILTKEQAAHSNTLLTGDFNATGWAFSLNKLVRQAGLERHSFMLPTFPSPNARIKRLPIPSFLSLDHIMTSGAVKVGNVVRARASVGDHYPLLARIALPQK